MTNRIHAKTPLEGAQWWHAVATTLGGVLSTIFAYQSPFLYIRILLWFFTLGISFLPFIGAETKFFSDWNITLADMYSRHYEGVLSVFVVTIAVAMFDVLGVLILLVGYQSYIALPATIIFGTLTILEVIVGLALGATIMAQMSGQAHASHVVMHGGILTLSAAVCLAATAFVAILSNEYRPKSENSGKARSRR